MLLNSPPARGPRGHQDVSEGGSSTNTTRRGTDEPLTITPFLFNGQLCSGAFNSESVIAQHKDGAVEHYASLNDVKVSNFLFGEAEELKENAGLQFPFFSTQRVLQQPGEQLGLNRPETRKATRLDPEAFFNLNDAEIDLKLPKLSNPE